jgi:UTP--glucose-1-phosphate uridylyltransferase
VLTKAVIPAAGLATRMASLTKGASKEMLPVAGRPMIHYVVQEAAEAGIVEICIVIRNGKEAIRRYFEDGGSDEVGKADRALEKLRNRCKIVFAYQAKPRGIGDAILCARDFVGEERFAFLVPDQLFVGPAGAISQMASKKFPPNSAVSSVIRIPASELEYFPGARMFICESYALKSNVVAITGIEPAGCASPTPMRGFGRTIFPPEVFRFLDAEFADPQTGEVDLLRTFRALLAEIPNYAVLLQGKAFDFGTPDGYQYFRDRFPVPST